MGGRHPRRIPLAAVVVSLAALTTPIHAQRDVNELRARAQQGDAAAQFNLGRLYVTGTGVPQNDAEATRWYRLAADQGHAGAQHNLGSKYDNGMGVPEDDAEAVRWYRLAAEQGHWEAQFRLGRMYDNGTGIARNDTQAVRWYRLAADQGHADPHPEVMSGRSSPTPHPSRRCRRQPGGPHDADPRAARRQRAPGAGPTR